MVLTGLAVMLLRIPAAVDGYGYEMPVLFVGFSIGMKSSTTILFDWWMKLTRAPTSLPSPLLH